MYMVYGIWCGVSVLKMEKVERGVWSMESHTPALTPHKPFKIKPTALPEMSRPV